MSSLWFSSKLHTSTTKKEKEKKKEPSSFPYIYFTFSFGMLVLLLFFLFLLFFFFFPHTTNDNGQWNGKSGIRVKAKHISIWFFEWLWWLDIFPRILRYSRRGQRFYNILPNILWRYGPVDNVVWCCCCASCRGIFFFFKKKKLLMIFDARVAWWKLCFIVQRYSWEHTHTVGFLVN